MLDLMILVGPFQFRIFYDCTNKLHDKCERQTHDSVCENRGFISSTLRLGTTLYLYSMISFHDGILRTYMYIFNVKKIKKNVVRFTVT